MQEKEKKPDADKIVAKNDNPEQKSKEIADNIAPGMTENVFRKGNKTITTRIVVTNSNKVEYKRVIADWGGKFFFKNNVSITEREFNEETNKYKNGQNNSK